MSLNARTDMNNEPFPIIVGLYNEENRCVAKRYELLSNDQRQKIVFGNERDEDWGRPSYIQTQIFPGTPMEPVVLPPCANITAGLYIRITMNVEINTDPVNEMKELERIWSL